MVNKYNLSSLTKKGRADILKEAKTNGVIIQECNTNGDVRCEYVIVTREVMHQCVDSSAMADGRSGDTVELKIWHATQPNLEY